MDGMAEAGTATRAHKGPGRGQLAAAALETLPEGVAETHVSLFDGTNCGLEVQGKPIFSVQYHPEASPGPRDSHYLFTRFVNLIREKKGEAPLPEHG